MRLADFMNDVARQADTAGLKINTADTRRVLAIAFDCLSRVSPSVMCNVIGQGCKKAEKRRAAARLKKYAR